ncbi:MAG: glycosyltransferase, partial [Lachnospiraceae bacterium]|nr:glycosyltransferase [Lachnospiraceae bacterium]
MPAVSVIVAIYNIEKYLPRALDSLVNQTLRDIEIIAVDDGSTDSCPQIADRYAEKDPRI